MSDKQRRPRRKTKKSAPAPSPTALGPQRQEEAKPPENRWAIVVEFEDGSQQVRQVHARTAHDAQQQVMRPRKDNGALASRCHIMTNPVSPDAVEHEDFVGMTEDEVLFLVVDRLRETGKLHSGPVRLMRVRQDNRCTWSFWQWHDGPQGGAKTNG